jgi:hypothetical protein
MSVEDQLRAAGRAVSEQVRDLPRLDLRTQQAAPRTRARTSRRWSRGGGWLIPMAAAAAVVAVAVTLVVVRNPPQAAHKAGAAPAASRSAGPAATSAPVDPEALPGYFVAINGLEVTSKLTPGQSGVAKDPLPDSVIVGDTLTGQRLATISPPAGSTFVGVTGTADDRTFVLGTERLVPGLLLPNQPQTWYLLRIRPGATPVQTLTRIDFPIPSSADINGIALSPDGTKLAVLYQVAGNDSGVFPYNGPFTLGIYSVATGAALRSWTGTDPYHGSYGYGSDMPDPNDNLTWTSDGQRLAFAYRSSSGPSASLYLRELNLADAGSDLFSDSTVIATVTVSTTGRSKIWCDSLGITGDGKTAVCGADLPRVAPVGATLDALTRPADQSGCSAPTDTVNPGLAEISLADDRLTRVLYEAEPKCMGGGSAAVLWSSPSGDTVLGTVSYPNDSFTADRTAIVLYSHGAATTLNWPGAATLLQANQTAF